MLNLHQLQRFFYIHQNLSFSEQRIRFLAFIAKETLKHHVWCKLPNNPTKLLPCCDFPNIIFTKILHLRQQNHSSSSLLNKMTQKSWQAIRCFKKKTLPTWSRLSPRPSKYWIPCWTKMEVRSFYGAKSYSLSQDTNRQGGTPFNPCIFPEFFVFQIETPNITLKTKNSWPMGKKTNGKNQRKIQRTMKPKGESAVGNCEKEKGQPANHNHRSNLI